MFPRPKIAENTEVLCSVHSEKVEYFYQGNSLSNSQLRCASCVQTSLSAGGHTKAQFQSDPRHETLAVTLLDVPRPSIDENLKIKPAIDFANAQLEHIIKDYRAKGYPPRNLAYVPDDEILVGCGYNGRVILWQVGDTVDFLSVFDIEGTIRCVKFVPAESNKLLIFGVDKDLHVYKLDGKSAVFLTKLECHCDVNDIEYLPDKQKLIVVGWSPYIRFWSIGKSFSFDRTIDATSYGAEQPLCTAIYIKDKNSIALEDKDGICIVDLEAENDTDRLPARYSNFTKKGYGLAYLSKSDQFMLRTVKNRACIVDAKTLTAKTEYNGALPCSDLPGFRFMPNEDESLILSNSNSTDLMIYKDVNYSVMNLTNLLTQSAGVEVLHDQYRFAVADQFSGTILIFRTNIFGNYKYRPHITGGISFITKDGTAVTVSPSQLLSRSTLFSPAKQSLFPSSPSPSKNLFTSNITNFKPPTPIQSQKPSSPFSATRSKLANSQTSSPTKRPQRQAAQVAQAIQTTTRVTRSTKAPKKASVVFVKKTRPAVTATRDRGQPLRATRQVKKTEKQIESSKIRDIKARAQRAIRRQNEQNDETVQSNKQQQINAPIQQLVRKINANGMSDPQLKLTFEIGRKVLTKKDRGAIGEDFPAMKEKTTRERPKKSEESPKKSPARSPVGKGSRNPKRLKYSSLRPSRTLVFKKDLDAIGEDFPAMEEKTTRERPRKSEDSPKKSPVRSPVYKWPRKLKLACMMPMPFNKANRAGTRSRSRDKGAVKKTGTRSTRAKRG